MPVGSSRCWPSWRDGGWCCFRRVRALRKGRPEEPEMLGSPESVSCHEEWDERPDPESEQNAPDFYSSSFSLPQNGERNQRSAPEPDFGTLKSSSGSFPLPQLEERDQRSDLESDYEALKSNPSCFQPPQHEEQALWSAPESNSSSFPPFQQEEHGERLLDLDSNSRAPESDDISLQLPQLEEQDQTLDSQPHPSGYEYEVFLSFRGPDVRKGFADYLYNSLRDVGVRVFRDNEELRSGNEIEPGLRQGIAQSKISIPIFSNGYVSSKWCLRELALIAKCRIKQKQLVKPIFYDVRPDQVKNQTGRYKEELQQHAVKYPQSVEQWRSALSEVGQLKGWVLKDTADGHEGRFVKLIVGDVLCELKKNHLPLSRMLVGLEKHETAVMSLLDNEVGDVRIVGIYGISGIGKTTLAKDIYNKLLDHSEYDGCSFLDSIREKYKQPNGPEWLQSKLIADITRHKRLEFGSTDEGTNMLIDRFRDKKVLILLDDVDQSQQLNALAGERHWFGPGSRIIVTTTDRGILRESPQVNSYYEMGTMDHDEAVELFNQNAFRIDPSLDPSLANLHPLSDDIVKAAGRIPLALEVIGGYLCGRGKREWEAMLEKLKERPDKKVLDKLKISYDDLEEEYKQIFLDTACFLIGVDIRVAVHMWKDCRFFPDVGIQVLLHRSLIKIREDYKLWMHDSLRDLGREIAREDNKLPRNRRRLWRSEDARNVLQNKKGTEYIEAVSLQSKPGWHQHTFYGKQFETLPNLRFLRLECDHLEGDFQPLSELRWLSLQTWAISSMPISLPLEKLKILDLSRSKLTEDWSGWSSFKEPVQLKVLDLSGCHLLSATPDLSVFPELERLNLQDCIRLRDLHPSMVNLQSLSSLNMKSCVAIKELPDQLGQMKTLTELIIDGAPITELPDSICCLTNLQRLSANDCSYLRGLPTSIGWLEPLVVLSLSRTAVETFPDSMGDLSSIEMLSISWSNLSHFPRAMGKLRKLKVINASNCEKLHGEIPAELGELCSLRVLKLDGTGIISIPDSIRRLSQLQTLHLTGCKNLKNLPELPVSLSRLRTSCQMEAIPNLTDLINLEELVCSTGTFPGDMLPRLESSQKLQSLPACLRKLHVSRGLLRMFPELSILSKLSDLALEKCYYLAEVPGLGNLVALKSLTMSWCPRITTLDGLEKLKSLKALEISFCENLGRLPDLSMLKKLSVINVRSCESLVGIPGLDGLFALTDLDIGNCKTMKNLPDLSSLKLLRSLSADECGNLEGLEGLGELEELLFLQISGCREMKELPNLSKLKKLKHLNIAGCRDIRQISELSELKSLQRIVISRPVELELANIQDHPDGLNSASLGTGGASLVSQILAEFQRQLAGPRGYLHAYKQGSSSAMAMDSLAVAVNGGNVIAIYPWDSNRKYQPWESY